jgi:hypothetical protein
MTAVTRTKLLTTPYESVYSIINNRSYIDDPRNSGITSSIRKMIYDSDPLDLALDFSLFPYVVLKLPKLEGETKSADGRFQWLYYTQEIVIRTLMGGSGQSRPDAGRTDMLNLTDALMYTFKNQTVLQSLRDGYIYNVELNQTDTNTTTYDDRNVFEASFELKYHFRFQVSA